MGHIIYISRFIAAKYMHMCKPYLIPLLSRVQTHDWTFHANITSNHQSGGIDLVSHTLQHNCWASLDDGDVYAPQPRASSFGVEVAPLGCCSIVKCLLKFKCKGGFVATGHVVNDWQMPIRSAMRVFSHILSSYPTCYLVSHS